MLGGLGVSLFEPALGFLVSLLFVVSAPHKLVSGAVGLVGGRSLRHDCLARQSAVHALWHTPQCQHVLTNCVPISLSGVVLCKKQ